MTHSSELLTALHAFGFDDTEAKVYLAGLELGSASVLELARRTRLARTTLYPVLENLCRRGIFRHGKQKRRAVYLAESPVMLEKTFAARSKQLHEAVPKLEAMRGTIHEGAGVLLYEGSDGFRQLWRKIFKSGVKEYCIMTSGTGLLDFVREPYLVSHIIAERVRRGIKSRQLIEDSLAARKIVARDSAELRESRFLPKNIALPASVIVFGTEVAFITTRHENTMILIASGEVAVTHRTLFDLLWRHAE